MVKAGVCAKMVSLKSKVSSARLRLSLVLALGLLAFSWPTIINKNVFLLADTTAYVRGADAAVALATGHTTEWTLDPISGSGGSTIRASAGRGAPVQDRRTVLAGRSIYYGALLYTLVVCVGFVGMALLQAGLSIGCATITALRLSSEVDARFGPGALALLLLALGAFTPIGYYAGYMVPDVFLGLGALAVATLVSFRAELGRREKLFWWIILTASLAVHSANILILGFASAVVLGYYVMSGALRAFPFASLGSAFLVGFISEVLFAVAIQTATGYPPVRPPFLAARVIADGPGRDYLREHCPRSTLVWCENASSLPGDSDAILWSTAPGQWSFTSASADQKQRMSAEEKGFVWGVIAERPRQVVESSLRSFAAQLSSWSLSEFNYTEGDRQWFERKLPPRSLRSIEETKAWHGEMPVSFVTSSTRFTTAVALLGLLIMFLAGMPDRAKKFAAVIALVILSDAFIAGTLSTPHDRYLMRVVWILPLTFLALLPGLTPAWRNRKVVRHA